MRYRNLHFMHLRERDSDINHEIAETLHFYSSGILAWKSIVSAYRYGIHVNLMNVNKVLSWKTSLRKMNYSRWILPAMLKHSSDGQLDIFSALNSFCIKIRDDFWFKLDIHDRAPKKRWLTSWTWAIVLKCF